jgi:hypothetical protein
VTRVEIRHVFRCSPDTFWNDVFGNEEFDRELYLESLKFPAYEILEAKTADDGTVKRRVKSVPSSEAPAVVQKALGENVSYVEVGTYDPKAQRYRFDIEPNRLKDKILIRGEMWTEPAGDEARRCVDIEVNVKIFGVGKLVESFISQSLRDNYEKAASFTNVWLDRKRA